MHVMKRADFMPIPLPFDAWRVQEREAGRNVIFLVGGDTHRWRVKDLGGTSYAIDLAAGTINGVTITEYEYEIEVQAPTVPASFANYSTVVLDMNYDFGGD